MKDEVCFVRHIGQNRLPNAGQLPFFLLLQHLSFKKAPQLRGFFLSAELQLH
ncbi:hypothetical protein SRDD_35160 [Serratia sp. DD3]|nr:hypothetical protein SRDD_35160 [Serratia sp. DD3]